MFLFRLLNCHRFSDTGIGLSASDVDLLFVPFQQADVSPGHLSWY